MHGQQRIRLSCNGGLRSFYGHFETIFCCKKNSGINLTNRYLSGLRGETDTQDRFGVESFFFTGKLCQCHKVLCILQHLIKQTQSTVALFALSSGCYYWRPFWHCLLFCGCLSGMLFSFDDIYALPKVCLKKKNHILTNILTSPCGDSQSSKESLELSHEANCEKLLNLLRRVERTVITSSSVKGWFL